jgi:hypothetical protein
MTDFIFQPMIIWTALLGGFALVAFLTYFHYSETSEALRFLCYLAIGFLGVVALPVALYLSESWSVLIAALTPHAIAALVLFIYVFSVAFDKIMDHLASLSLDDDPWG